MNATRALPLLLIVVALALTGIVLTGLAIWIAIEWQYGDQIKIKDSIIESQANVIASQADTLKFRNSTLKIRAKRLESCQSFNWLHVCEYNLEEDPEGLTTWQTQNPL